MSTEYDLSEFSSHEILYMGHEGLVFVVEHTICDTHADPFELIARLEEELGQPIVHHKETPM